MVFLCVRAGRLQLGGTEMTLLDLNIFSKVLVFSNSALRADEIYKACLNLNRIGIKKEQGQSVST